MRPERDVYERQRNEVEQQFAQHNLEKDMADDYRQAFAGDAEKRVRKMKAENRGRLLLLVLIAAGVALVLAIS